MKLKFSSVSVKLHAIYVGLYIIVIYLKLMLVKHTGKWHPSKYAQKYCWRKNISMNTKKGLQSCLLFVLEAAADSLLSFGETWIGRFGWKSFVHVGCLSSVAAHLMRMMRISDTAYQKFLVLSPFVSLFLPAVVQIAASVHVHLPHSIHYR